MEDITTYNKIQVAWTMENGICGQVSPKIKEEGEIVGYLLKNSRMTCFHLRRKISSFVNSVESEMLTFIYMVDAIVSTTRPLVMLTFFYKVKHFEHFEHFEYICIIPLSKLKYNEESQLCYHL